jgi:hypothetical protein
MVKAVAGRKSAAGCCDTENCQIVHFRVAACSARNFSAFHIKLCRTTCSELRNIVDRHVVEVDI